MLPNQQSATQSYDLVTYTDQQKNSYEEDDSVKTKNTAISKNNSGNFAVRDRLNIVFLVFVLHGMGVLMPWNMFINANSYFVDFKLNVDSSMQENRKNFLIYIGVAANVPNVVFNAVNIFVQFGGETLGIRIVCAIIIEITIFLMTIILAMVDTDSWVGVFFGITMASVVVINMANGIYQNSVYGLAAKLPMEYSMAVMVGNNISGTFTSIILILSIAASPNPKTAAIYYFITALVVLLACVDTYLSLPLNRFYRYYDELSKKAVVKNVGKSEPLSYWQIFLKVWPQCLNVFMVFFVTLAIFPAMLAETKRFDAKFFISPKFFTPITCFLSFNFFAMVGSFLPNWFKTPGPNRLWMPIVARFLLIPFFMFCNYLPESRSLPVGVESDWAYSLMVVVLGLSSGYCSSLAMMYAPRYVDAENASVAGMIAAFFLIFGVFCGVNFTFVISWLVQNM